MKTLAKGFLLVLMLWSQESKAIWDNNLQAHLYDLWVFGGGNLTTSVVFKTTKEISRNGPLPGILGTSKESCHFDLASPVIGLKPDSDSNLKQVRCDLGPTRKTSDFEVPRQPLLYLPDASHVYSSVEIKRRFEKSYGIKEFFLDLEITNVAAVSITFHTEDTDDEDLMIRYTKQKESCFIYFPEIQHDEECLGLKGTNGLLHLNMDKEVVATDITIRVVLHRGVDKRKDIRRTRDVTVRHMIIQGTCVCNEYANGCIIVNGALSCKCMTGRCNQKCTGQWMISERNEKICTDISSISRRKKRKVCTCNPLGTLYGLCHPLESLGNKCLCKRNFFGQFCDACADGYYGYPKCRECKCNAVGSKSSGCDKETGSCECKTLANSGLKYTGKTCSECPNGHFGFPFCKPCKCSFQKASHGTCDDITGKCICNEGFTGKLCNKCASGFYSYPNCTACNCSKSGSLSLSCNDNGICECQPRFAGDKCNKCADGFKSFPICTACNCAKEGSLSSTCNPTTGQCPCKQGFAALRCHLCKNTGAAFPHCKQKCYCHLRGVVPGRPSQMCGSTSNSCFCKRYVSGARCNQCKALYYNLTASNPSGCEHCSCSQIGTIGGLRTCSQSSGECLCKNAVSGRRCDKCKRGYYGLSASRLLGCQACKCNIGGSLGPSCDEYGVCKCRKGITGVKCDKLASRLLYVPSLFDLKFELEDGRDLQGAPVRYRYNYAEFPGFSSKGYVAMGVTQSVITLPVTVPKSASYKIALNYILREDKTVSCVVRLREKTGRKTFHYGIAVLKSSLNKLSKQQHALVSNVRDWFLINKGEWELTISSTAAGLLVDYAILMPDDYFHGHRLDKVPLMPCTVGQSPFQACETYRYLPLKNNKTALFEAEEAYTGGSLQGGERKNPEIFLDPDILRELKSTSMAVFSNVQKVLNFDIKTKTDGDHYLVVSFFNPDPTAYEIRVFLDQKQGFAEMSSCTLKFICRVVILERGGAPKAFTFSSSKTKTAIFIANVAGTLAVDAVTAIPVEEWADDFIRPSLYCISINGVCTRPANYPDSQVQVLLFPDSSNPADPLTGSVHAEAKDIVVYKGQVPRVGSYSLIYQYYQPKHPAFAMKTQVNTGNSSEVTVSVKFCPSTSGCRLHHSVYAASLEMSVAIEVPNKRDFWIDRIFLVPDEEFFPDILTTKSEHMSKIYKSKCLDKQLIPLQKPVSRYCRDAIFTLSLKFNEGPKICGCNSLGSVTAQCKDFDGQCECRPNVVGRACDRCRTGYYNFPNCRPCRCFLPGSFSPDCSSFGQCKCKPQFGGWRCTRCNAMGYFGFPECKPCLCDKEGSLSTFCRGSSGQCQCRVNFEGRTCNKCRVGYQNYPECKRCKCDPAGIVVTPQNPTGCPSTAKGDCLCKKNVEGENCDRCKRNFFNLQLFNKFGCDACECHAPGTINGITSCGQRSGKCHCKVFVGGRTCSECVDGYFNLNSNNFFGCQACDCNPGGSLDKTCNKATGQCKCRPNVVGRRCDRIKSGEFYIPTLHHIISRPAEQEESKIVQLAGIENLKKEVSLELELTVPRTAVFYFVIHVEFCKDPQSKLSLSIIDSVTKGEVIQSNIVIKRPSNHSSTAAFSVTLHDNNGMFDVRLLARNYIIELMFNTTVLSVRDVVLIPEEYDTADVLKKQVTSPCTISNIDSECLRYTYLTMPRRQVYTHEAESVRQNALPAVGPEDLGQLSFNGAVRLGPGNALSFSVNGTSNSSYIAVLQYYNIHNQNASFKISAVIGNKIVIASGTFVHCPYTFGCRQVALDDIGTIKRFAVPQGVEKWSIIVEVLNGNVTLDLLGLVPFNQWSMDYIKPTVYCRSVKGSCVTASVTLPEKGQVLQIESGTTLKPATFLPSNLIGNDTKLIHIYRQKTTLSWTIKVPRGRYVIIFKYYQPARESFTTKIVVSTRRRAFAGKFEFRHCPTVSGCHGVLHDLTWQDQVFAIYINVNLMVVSIDIPKGSHLWMDYVLLLPAYEYTEDFLRHQPFSLSKEFRGSCLEENFKLLKPRSKLCEHLLFKLTTAYNNGPLTCNCHPQGSTSRVCSHLGGQCRCKSGVSGRRCDRCKSSRTGFPSCKN